MQYLVGAKEAGEILGWDRRKVSTYHFRGVLPKPVTILSSGPIWLRTQIETYKTKKESGLPIYYIADEGIVYKCCYNLSMSKTELTYEEIKSLENYLCYEEKDIRIFKKFILENHPIVEFLSLEIMILLRDLGILEADVFNKYIEKYLHGNSMRILDGRNEEHC